MDPSTSARSRIKTLVVTIACLFGAAVGAYFLYEDFNVGGGAGRGKPMAKVDQYTAKVRRKASSTYIWTNVRKEELLYKKDSVQTGDGSAAAIKFNDGSILEIGENSLIVVDDIENLSLNFLRGSLVIRGSDGGDRRVSVGKDGKARIQDLLVRLIKPAPSETLFSTRGKLRNVKFSWKPRSAKVQADIPKFYLQVSKTKAFAPGSIQTIETESSQVLNSNLELEDGKYYWRIADDKKVLTETRTFQVAKASPIQPLWPSSSKRVLVWGKDQNLQFRWRAPKVQDDSTDLSRIKHEIEVSADPSFRKVLLREKIAPNSGVAALKGIPIRKLFWRIKSTYPDFTIGSKVERFLVEKAKELEIELNTPDESDALSLASKVKFGWSADADNMSYIWEIESSDGKTKIAKAESKAQTAIWNKPLTGGYRWRVTAKYKESIVGQTDWRALSLFEGDPIELEKPKKDQKIHFWDKRVDFTFEWDKDDLQDDFPGSYYKVEVAQDAGFKKRVQAKKTRRTKMASRHVRLGDETYFWRVKLVDKSGRTLKSSKSSKFDYGVYPPLRAPAGERPAIGQTINILKSQEAPFASWKEVDGAKGYQITIKSGDKVVFRKVTEKNKVQLNGLKPDSYNWTVQAIDERKRLGEKMDPRSFRITYGDKLVAPEVISPEVQ